MYSVKVSSLLDGDGFNGYESAGENAVCVFPRRVNIGGVESTGPANDFGTSECSGEPHALHDPKYIWAVSGAAALLAWRPHIRWTVSWDHPALAMAARTGCWFGECFHGIRFRIGCPVAVVSYGRSMDAANISLYAIAYQALSRSR